MKRLIFAAWTLVGVLALCTAVEYPGRWPVYALFTLTANALLYFGFRRNAIFFDAFIGVFFWLGFWLKLSVRVAFFDGEFHEPLGYFDRSGAAYDRALLAASLGFMGLLAASALRARFFNYPAIIAEPRPAGLLAFYAHHRRRVLIGFVALVVAVTASNLFLGVYQRGAIPKTVLPFGLNGVYSWLLLFGLASFSALILHLEFRLRRETSYLAVGLSLLEGFLSSLSLLSRGMILNTSALGYGALRSVRPERLRTTFRFWIVCFAAFGVLFAGSVLAVNYVRNYYFDQSLDIAQATRASRALVLDRWVGMEGLMAVAAHPRQGWDLWAEAWREVPARKLSFFDSTFIASPYANTDLTKHNFISLPGIVAFFFYPGSFSLLLGAMFGVGLLAAAVEISVFKLGGRNLILCALLAQVIASRYVHFGYAPRQTYLLFGALYLNVFLIYFADKALAYWQRSRRV